MKLGTMKVLFALSRLLKNREAPIIILIACLKRLVENTKELSDKFSRSIGTDVVISYKDSKGNEK
jgi:hypothetical protein